MSALTTLLSAAASSVVASAISKLPDRQDQDQWTRINFRGKKVSLQEGPAITAGIVSGALLNAAKMSRRRVGLAQATATTGAGVFGLIDDLAGDNEDKGLRGHLGALASGRVTTGGLKVLGIGSSAFVAAMILGGSHRPGRSALGRMADVVIDTGLIAGSANLINLLDLRPGRALKATAAATVALIPCDSHGLWGSLLATSASVAPGDLSEETMAGDCGANSLGAALGVMGASSLPRWARAGALIGITALTVLSERVSFSKVIEDNEVLHRIDSWGRVRE